LFTHQGHQAPLLAALFLFGFEPQLGQFFTEKRADSV
jgi:hypothetical protein